MAKIEPANLLLTDKNGNTGLVKSLTNKDITTLKGVVTNVDYIKDYMNTNNITLPIQGNIHLTATDEEGNNGKTLLGTSSGTLTWNGKPIGAITGEIKYFAFNTAPDGYLVCNGAEISRETYADLFSVIGTTFGSGDGSTTFNLPDLRDRYIIGANTNALGTKVAEQLPNIKGSFGITNGNILNNGKTDMFVSSSGAFSNPVTTNGYSHIAGSVIVGSSRNNIDLNATNSNSIYTDNGHVYPLSLALLPCIKY